MGSHRFPFNNNKTTKNKYFVLKEQKPAVQDFRELGDIDADDAKDVYLTHKDTLEPHQPDEWSGNLYKNEIIPTIKNYLGSSDAKFEPIESVDPQGIKKRLREELPSFRYFEANRNIEDETKTSRNALLGQLLENAVASIPEDEKEPIKDALSDVDQKLNSGERFEEITSLEQNISKKLSQQIPIDGLQIQIDIPELESVLENARVTIDDGVETDIDKMGAGVHTSFILAGLWELASQERQNETDVIFGLEEPENDLHPHAQRQLNDTVDRLTNLGYQVMLSTHSAFLVNPSDLFNTVRVEKRATTSKLHAPGVSDFSDEDIRTIERRISPKNNELLFSRAVLVGEGESEAAVLPILTALIHEKRKEAYALDRLGVSLIEEEGKAGFKKILKLTRAFGIRTVAVLDDDSDVDDGHDGLRSIINERADELVELPDDLEEQLFKATNLEDFCSTLYKLEGYEKSAKHLGKRANGAGDTEVEVMQDVFEEVSPSKPEFGREIASTIDADDLPEGVVTVAERCRKVSISEKTN